MKCTFWFGMIWTLAAAVYSFSQVMETLLFDAEIFQDSILFKSDAAVYHLVSYLLPGERYFYFEVFVNTLLAMAMLSMAWKFGFIDRERIKFWHSVPRYIKTLPEGYRGFAMRVAIIAVVLFGTSRICPVCSCVSWVGNIVNLYYSTSGPAGEAGLVVIHTAPLIPLAFMVSSLIYAISVSGGVWDFGRNAVVAIAGGFCLLGVVGGINLITNSLDANKKISDIPGVTQHITSRNIIFMTDKPFR
ncbi:MAG: hypothetical protein HZC51_09800 [Nitrospirae bacterium]|nr:hypothetical protein [Nitrospirota bacterium]